MALFVDAPQGPGVDRQKPEAVRLESQGTVLRKNLLKGFPRSHRVLEKKMDLVFVDPPYGMGMLLPVLEELCSLGILGSPATLVAQSEQREVLPPV